MSYEIMYDKAFIKVGDKYIPIVNQGSSNCFDFDFNGRQIPEKNWHILNYYCRKRVLFTEAEIGELAERMEEISGGGAVMKSRYRAFEPGEMRNWILAGMKRAYTVEEYRKCGNTLMFSYCDPEPCNSVAFTTTQQLEDLITAHADAKELNVTFANNRTVYRPKKPKVDKLAGLEKVYALTKKDDKGRVKYFCKYRRRRFVFATDVTLPFVRLFPSEKEAKSYLNKHRDKLGTLSSHGLEVLCVENPRKEKGEKQF